MLQRYFIRDGEWSSNLNAGQLAKPCMLAVKNYRDKTAGGAESVLQDLGRERSKERGNTDRLVVVVANLVQLANLVLTLC